MFNFFRQKSLLYVNLEVKIHVGPMRGGHSTYLEAVDDFIVDTHVLAKLPHVLQESSDNHKEFSHEPP